MGFLSVFGIILQYIESKQYFKIIKDNFVKYVIRELQKKYICKKPMFGFEFELHKISIDDKNKRIYIDLTAQNDIINSSKQIHQEFHLSHEYGGWMYEVIPNEPFLINNLNLIEKNIQNLYRYLTQKYGNKKFLSIGSFPLLGVGKYYINEDEKDEDDDKDIIKDEEEKKAKEQYLEDINNNKLSYSNYLNDKIINRHPRFGNLTRNIRQRRGSKVDIEIPLFKDKNTDLTTITNLDPIPGFITMDAMGFGMGCCSLQVTIDSDSLEDCLKIYDQLIPLAPLFLVLTSSSPIFRGKLSDYDNRWIIISQSVDDRTEEERNPKSDKYVYKSRYSPVYSYIGKVNKYYNDYPKFPINQEYYKQFIDSGISENLATHFCNLLVRDPLAIFDKKINITDENDMTHFENINSSNWNSLRFKLPRPADKEHSYKIEIRTCDLQLTPFENTSIIHFIINLYNIILKNNSNFIIPITKVDKNFENAYCNDAINTQKFWWRINCFDNIDLNKDNFDYIKDEKENIILLTINEILNGVKEYNYPGLIPVIKKEINNNPNYDENIRQNLLKFANHMEKKAKGEIWTDAKYIRKFISEHPKYNKDSIITEEINYDLINHLLEIQNGNLKPKELFG